MKVSVIGTGKIVQEALPVLVGTKGIEVRSIWARHSMGRAQELAGRYGIARATENYEEVLADTETEAVYIALINSVHYDFALRALQAGKHVVLEKPACMCYSELARLAKEARGRGLMLLEAVTLLHLPAFRLLQSELLPLLGTLRHVECNYSQRSSRLDAYRRGDVLPAFDPAAGGGALMDINIYNLHFVEALLGQPKKARYVCHRGFNEVDLSGTAILEYEGCTALCTGAKDTDAPSFGLLQGDNGWLRIEGPVSTMRGMTLCLRGQQPRQVKLKPVAHRLAPEFAAFADMFRCKDMNTMNRLLDHSLAVLQTVDCLH